MSMTLEESRRRAEPIIDLLLGLSQEDRESVLEAVAERVCLTCASANCSGWCDYDSYPGGD